MAVLNLAAGLLIATWPERQYDLEKMNRWGRQWLVEGTNIYATSDDEHDYPPHAILALSPLSLLPDAWAVRIWAAMNLDLAVAAPYLAVRIVRPQAPWRTIALPVLIFLCWGGFRTLLQFSLITLVFGLLAMRLADRRPAWSGVCLGLALMKPQIAVPIFFWALFTRRLRIAAAGVMVVIAGVVLFCIRAGANPIAVIQRYADTLHTHYLADQDLIMVGLAQLRPLIALAIPDPGIVNAAAIAIAVGLLACICLLGFAEGKRGDVLLISAPPLAAVWSLLTFYHLTYGFVVLLPVATLLVFENEPSTRAFRATVFGGLQLALMIDVPGMWPRVAAVALPARAGDLWGLPAHADRVLMTAMFVCLVVLALRRRRLLPSQHPAESAVIPLRVSGFD